MKLLRAAALGAAVTTLITATAAAPASAQSIIQPGESIVADGSYCTLAWIFDGPGGTYGSTAAHCVSAVGQEVSLAAGSLGEPIERIGEVAFMGNADEEGRDYAFIKIDDADLGKVDPSLKGHPTIPTGITQDPAEGDVIQFSGNGVGFHLTQPTREARVGVLNRFGDKEHDVLGGVSPGDSGGPVADLTNGGTALGIVNTVGVGVNSGALTVVTAGEGGTNLTFVLADAASRGFGGLKLRTV